MTVDYELWSESGELLDRGVQDEQSAIRYVHGYGMLVPGLEAALAGLGPGDDREVIVPAHEGYGERDEGLVLEVERTELPQGERVEVGDELVAQSPDGEELSLRVVEVREDRVIVDANHPLAGVTLRYRVRVRQVRLATLEEIERAASDLEAARDRALGPDGAQGRARLRLLS